MTILTLILQSKMDGKAINILVIDEADHFFASANNSSDLQKIRKYLWIDQIVFLIIR